MIPTAIHARGIAVLLLASLTSAGAARSARAAGVAGEPWGPGQATGAPDTPEAADAPTAWCPLEPDAGPEWLLVHFEKKVSIAEVRIRESFNPGAVARVSVPSEDIEDGTSSVLWEGRDPTAQAPEDFTILAVPEIVGQSVLIELDTARRTGWNAIDAVELVGRDGSHQWASGAAASSTYADVGGLLAAEYAPEARVFADAVLGIRMAAPGWWIRANPAMLDAPGRILRAWTRDGVTTIAIARVVLQDVEQAWSAETLRGHAAAALDLLGAEVQAWEVHRFRDLGALGLVAAGTGDEPRMKQHWVAVPRERDVLLFLLSAPEASFDATERIFQKMLATVEIDGKKSIEK